MKKRPARLPETQRRLLVPQTGLCDSAARGFLIGMVWLGWWLEAAVLPPGTFTGMICLDVAYAELLMGTYFFVSCLHCPS